MSAGVSAWGKVVNSQECLLLLVSDIIYDLGARLKEKVCVVGSTWSERRERP